MSENGGVGVGMREGNCTSIWCNILHEGRRKVISGTNFRVGEITFLSANDGGTMIT